MILNRGPLPVPITSPDNCCFRIQVRGIVSHCQSLRNLTPDSLLSVPVTAPLLQEPTGLLLLRDSRKRTTRSYGLNSIERFAGSACLSQRLRDAIAVSMASGAANGQPAQPQVQPCRYKVGKTLGAGSYSVVKECVHIDTGRYYAAKVINKRLMAGREHMVCCSLVRGQFSSY